MQFNEAKWTEHFVQFEGKYRHMYLDGEGVITIGIGCQIFEPTTLPLLRKSTSIRANTADIFSDYNAVKALPAGKGPGFYDRVCLLYLPEADIQSLFMGRLKTFIRSIEDSITSLEDAPESAAMVLVDMAFNLGIRGLSHGFPKFMNAFLAKDWKVAALECKREGIQKERNEWARQSLESLISFQA